MKICKLAILVLPLLMFVAAPNKAQTGSPEHVHGRGQAKVKINGDKLSVSLQLPVQSILGAGCKQKSEEQKQALARAEAMLLQHDNIVKLTAASECKLSSKFLKVKRFHTKRRHEHANFILKFKFRCIQPTELNKVKFVLFDNFPMLENLDIVFSKNSTSARAKELTRTQDTLHITGGE